MKIYIFMLYIIAKISSNCIQGCLLCSNQECLYCDKEQNYYRVGTICTKKELENCLKSDNGEKCTLCNETFYSDYSSGKCRSTEKNERVENCKYHKFANECEVCNDKFYLNTNKCIPVETEIKDCKIYQSKDKCKECIEGKRLSDEFDLCLDFPDPNCMTVTNLKCLKCADGYSFYDNTYLYNYTIFTNDQKKKANINNLNGDFYNICARVIANNCIKLKNFFQCEECSNGYFLTPLKTCELLPEEPIENCFEYKKKNDCRLCLDGYYLYSPSECKPHDKLVPLCSKMSNTIKDTCSECEAGYYLDNNICLVRSLKISGCQTLAKESDTCQECVSQFISNEGNTMCLEKIDNCQEYIRAASQVSCLQCDPGYYYNTSDKRCSPVLQIFGCEKYQNSSVKDDLGRTYRCSGCQRRYYLDQNYNCILHDSFTYEALYCMNWSLTSKNVCDSCDTKEVLFDVMNYCEQVSIQKYDENALFYTFDPGVNNPVSDICKPGFYLDVNNGKKCFKNPIEYCNIYDGSKCTQCSSSSLENYFPSTSASGNRCILSYKYVIENCQSTNTIMAFEDLNYNICNNCYAPYYPEVFKQARFCIPKNTIQNNFDDTDKINDCKIYDPKANKCLICVFDSAQKVIREGKCVSQCANEEVIFTYKEDQFFVCVKKATIYGCNRVIEEIAGTVELPVYFYHCVECMTNFLPKISNDDEMNFVKYETFSYLPAKYTQHFKAKNLSYDSLYNRIPLYDSCVGIEDNEGNYFDVNKVYSVKHGTNNYIPKQPNYIAGSTFWTSCKALKQNTFSDANKKYCIMCNFGFTGYYVLAHAAKDELGNFTYYYMIPECYLMETCEYGIYYKGLGANLSIKPSKYEFWTSCHQCNDKNLIPTFAKSRIGKTILNENGQATNATKLGDANDDIYEQTFCAFPGTLLNKDLPNPHPNEFFPKFCGIQEIEDQFFLSDYNQLNYSTANPKCRACRPGYKATLSDDLIIACDEIANCDPLNGFNTFNKCLKCNTGYFLNDQEDECKATTIQNCYKGNIVNNVENCHICDEGYVPARDQKSCVLVNINKCVKKEIFEFDKDSNGNILPNAPFLGYGCSECDLGYLAIIFQANKKVCVRSSEIANRIFDRMGIENCSVYSSPTACVECSVGFVLPNGVVNKCILSSTIPNCMIYNADETCKTCNERYFLSFNKCINGSNYISNCLVFDSETTCAKCVELYVRVKNSETNRTECYYAGSALKRCNVFNHAFSLQGKLKCTQCDNNYYPKDLVGTEGFKVCSEVPAIINCKIYGNDKKCQQCYDNYWLRPPLSPNQIQSCVERTNYPYQACNIVSLNSDGCEQCDDGYYVRNNSCEFKPTGVFGCEVYQDLKTCLKCRDNQYVMGNICRKVPQDNYILKCLYYKDEITCSDCVPGYLLINNTCKAILISDCEVYEDETKCKICKSQFFLTELKTCQSGIVQNCLIHASVNTCQICETNFYVNNGLCNQIDEIDKINDCTIYEAPKKCSLCGNSSILTKNQESCLSFTNISSSNSNDSLLLERDMNCLSYKFDVHCKVCKPGFKFDGGTCVKCSANLNECHFCDYFDDNKCHVCKTGSYQNEEGQCISFIKTQDNNIKTDNTDNQENQIDGNQIFKIMLLALFLMF